MATTKIRAGDGGAGGWGRRGLWAGVGQKAEIFSDLHLKPISNLKNFLWRKLFLSSNPSSSYFI
jgi:hypothetical protein